VLNLEGGERKGGRPRGGTAEGNCHVRGKLARYETSTHSSSEQQDPPRNIKKKSTPNNCFQKPQKNPKKVWGVPWKRTEQKIVG